MDVTKKKHYVEMQRVTDFMDTQSLEVQEEYMGIVRKLELEGRLFMPFGEKLNGREPVCHTRH